MVSLSPAHHGGDGYSHWSPPHHPRGQPGRALASLQYMREFTKAPTPTVRAPVTHAGWHEVEADLVWVLARCRPTRASVPRESSPHQSRAHQRLCSPHRPGARPQDGRPECAGRSATRTRADSRRRAAMASACQLVGRWNRL